jgi:two-component system, NtrC family, response regulator AtoC
VDDEFADVLSPTVPVGERSRTGAGEIVILALGKGELVTHVMGDAPVVFGREPTSTVCLQDPSLGRRHARLTWGGPAGVIEDLGSTNGTRVNGARLPARGQASVQLGDVIELGEIVVLVRVRSATSSVLDDRALIDRVARSQITVLILGETGAGKERWVDAIHARSERARGPLIKINCAALSETLLESELFGHERGAFTGAVGAKAGLIEAAEGGTLLLDEVGELSLALQAKLLRVLEQREVMRVGATTTRAIDVRFVAATHRDLQAMVAEGRFRQDLYYRLDGFTLRIPPLRARRDELPQLVTELIAETCTITPPPRLDIHALARLSAYSWPGNVRELRNVIAKALVRWTGGPLQTEHFADLPESVSTRPAPGGDAAALFDDVDAYERKRILDTLERLGGNQTKAAAELGISRRTLVNRLQAWGLTKRR